MNKSLLQAASSALRMATLLGLTGSIVVAQPAPNTTDNTKKTDEPQKLERFEVTGSRVKRMDYETPAPVASFTAEDIEIKGYTSIGEFVQSLPFNSGTANSIYQTASFTRGAATANLRGLGSQRFLTLVNGRRAVPYALVNSANRSVFDFNNLPFAAVESIELLKDGASAIYGADAISGVLNIKLKKNFSGLAVDAYYGNTLKDSGGDTGTIILSAVAGAGTAKTKIMTALEVKTENSNFIHDYGITDTDYSYLGANKGQNNNSTANWPANFTLTRAQATALGYTIPSQTASSWTFVVTGGKPTGSPTLASFSPAPASASGGAAVPNENRYNFAPTYAIYPSSDRISSFTSAEHEFNDNLKAFAEVMYSKNSTYYAFTPGVITYSTEGLSLPANNPYNPFGVALTTLSGRSNFGPVRKFDTEGIASNVLAGLRGTFMNNWDWETGVSYGYSQVTTVNRNAMRATTYQAALNGTLSGYVGKFLNPFGPSDEGLTKALFTSSTGTSKADGLTWDASVSGKLLTLPAGDLGIAAGLEMRNEKLTTNPDTAAYLGSGGGLPLTGKRSVASQYVELTAPVFKAPYVGSAEVQVAGRHEHYSDFGNTKKPKVGAKWRLPDNRIVNVMLRGSYSESFQAPALGLLYASQTTAFSSTLLQDPLRLQDPPVQQRIVTGGNPNLVPETARVKYAGVVIEVPAVKGLTFAIDYFDMRINSVIVTPSATFLLSERGRAQFPNAIVRDNTLGNPGPILRIESVPQNNTAAYQLYRGFDYEVRYQLRNTRVGSFNFVAQATQITKTGSDSGLGSGFFDNTGLYYNPEWKASVNAGWRYKDFGANVNVDWTGKYFNDNYTAAGWGENPYTLVSPSFSYAGFWNTKITVGATNVFNNRPPANGRETLLFDPNAYSAGALGRFLYVRVSKEF
ncbi:TonB-dependent receptor plug domain-containing protein [Opitutus sp. ER46]|uniref:TonB-dependent receptor plug domain-containing protein n=1 Tax=Opitutus sp. ER46 TaxID=2161864 RepID=UPI000D306A58|nr:TonB-dependent receptor plug domain-containing protein [Opitutus sp. ER46]PTX91507.1 hypothetical protein DB354_16600 [Opitutus sp. ER46]